MTTYGYVTDMELDIVDRAAEFASKHFGVKKQRFQEDEVLTQMALKFFWYNYLESENEV